MEVQLNFLIQYAGMNMGLYIVRKVSKVSDVALGPLVLQITANLMIRYIPFQCCTRGTYRFLTYFLFCPDGNILSPRDKQTTQQSLSLISNKFLELLLFIPDSTLHVL